MSELLPRSRAILNRYLKEQQREINFQDQEQEYSTVGFICFCTMLNKIYTAGTTNKELQKEIDQGLKVVLEAMTYDPQKMKKLCSETFRTTTTKEIWLYGDSFNEKKKNQGQYLENLGLLKKQEFGNFILDTSFEDALWLRNADSCQTAQTKTYYNFQRHDNNIHDLATFYYDKINCTVSIQPIDLLNAARKDIEYYIGAYDPQPNDDIYYQQN